MLKNFFKTAFRNLLKGKTTGFVNLIGLSTGMAAAVFIFIWVQNELTVNNFYTDKEHIYRITHAIGISKDESWVWETSPLLLGEFAEKEIPEIKKISRVMINNWGGPVMNINNQLFAEKTSAYIDRNWFDIFKYDFTSGNSTAFASDPYSIVLTESKAKKYFGNINPVGKIIKVDTLNFTVQGVVKDNPSNSSFQFDVLMHRESRLNDKRNVSNDRSWGNFNFISFLQLKPGADEKLVEKKLNDILDKNRKENSARASLQPLSKIYFEDNLQSTSMPHGNKTSTYIFGLLGILLLFTACINYINLTTARASLRAKEIGVRKISGAGKSSLFAQFIIESLTVCFFSILISLALIQVLLPFFNSITEKYFGSPFTTPEVWNILGATILFTTLMNGIYPAILLSSFKPLNVFRGISVLKLNDGFVRRSLVVFQFSLSILLITGSIVIYRQLNFIQKSNPGYNVEQVMSIQIPWRSFYGSRSDARKTMIQSMKQGLQKQSSIAAVSVGGAEIVNVSSASSGNADWDGRDSAFNPTIANLRVDTGFKNMFKLELASGRWFQGDAADENNYLINETAAREFNIREPLIGARFTWGGDTGKIIGVVKDFNFKSLHEKIGPMVLSNNSGSDSYIFIKTMPGNIPEAIRSANSVWSEFLGDQPFSYNFLDESFNTLYKTDLKTSKLILIFSIIAVIISALGLFGLATFTAEQRTKEIGIRKVLGASVRQLTGMLSREFIVLVFIAILIATPLAGWIMSKWLENFAYRTSLSAGIFFTAGISALLIAVISVSFRAVQAALANPVKSLRTE